MIHKVRLSRFLIAPTLLSIILYAQEVSATQRIVSLQGLKPSPTHCQLGPKVQFLDDTTLLITNAICAKDGVESRYQHAVADLNGSIRNSVELSESSNYASVGPPGYVLFPADQQGWLIFDTDLHPKGNLPIPSGEFPGSVTLSPSPHRHRTIFRLPRQSLLDSYTGNSSPEILSPRPAKYTGPLPFPGITDSGAPAPGAPNLHSPTSSRLPANSGSSIIITNSRDASKAVPKPHFQTPHGSLRKANAPWCFRQSLSVSQPRHVLVYCMTSYYLPTGNCGLLTHRLASITISVYVAYDATGKVLTKGTYHFNSPPSLSPNGRLLALTRGKNVILYQLP